MPVLCLPCIGLLRLVQPVKGMEAWAKQFPVGFTTTASHSLDGIHRGGLGHVTFLLSFHFLLLFLVILSYIDGNVTINDGFYQIIERW